MTLINKKLVKRDGSIHSVSPKDIMAATGLSQSAAATRLRQTDSYERAFRPRQQHGSRAYTLDCGRVATLFEIGEECGINRNTLYNRVHTKGWRNYDQITQQITKTAWVEEPTTIVAGIPMNPAYLDGCLKRVEQIQGFVSMVRCDREGKPLSDKESSALMRYRDAARAEWAKGKSVVKSRA